MTSSASASAEKAASSTAAPMRTNSANPARKPAVSDTAPWVTRRATGRRLRIDIYHYLLLYTIKVFLEPRCRLQLPLEKAGGERPDTVEAPGELVGRGQRLDLAVPCSGAFDDRAPVDCLVPLAVDDL